MDNAQSWSIHPFYLDKVKDLLLGQASLGTFSVPPVIHASNTLCTVLLYCAISHRQKNAAVRKIYTRRLKVCKGGKEIVP